MKKASEPSKTPWLSVIMPVYNGERYLEQALCSLERQQGADMEVLVVDDGSTDRSRDIIQSFEDRILIRPFYREHSGNWVAQTNVGIKEARGKFVCFLHQDDLWLENRLKVLKALTNEFPQAVLYLHPSWFVDEMGRRLGKWSAPFPEGRPLLNSEFILSRLIVQNFVSIPAPLFRREAAISVGFMDENLWYTADWKYWLAFAKIGSWAYSREPLSCFRIHSASQTVQRSKNQESYRQQHEAVQKEFLNAFSIASPKKAELEVLAQAATDLNVLLASSAHGKRLPLGELFRLFIHLRPARLFKLLYYARVLERVSARIRAGLHLPREAKLS